MKTALVLSGGGARAAYQVGVLKAISEILPMVQNNPFPIVCGTSAGAINAATLATQSDNFHAAIAGLRDIWENLSPDQVHYTGYQELLKSSFKLIGSFFHSGIARGRPLSVLDNTPLFHLLVKHIRLERLQPMIEAGHLHALNIAALSYLTGHSTNFFQGHASIENWHRARRIGERTHLSIQHLLASSALPAIFPAVRIGKDYFGDGALRQMTPMSSPLHLGADRIFVIGVRGGPNNAIVTEKSFHSPSLAQIGGQMLNNAFVDAMEEDIETLERFNELIDLIPEAKREEMAFKKVDVMRITPSVDFEELASDYVKNLPLSMRTFLKTIGATRTGGGSSIASYLMFEANYCKQLIHYGYQDCMKHKQAISRFFGSYTVDCFED